MTRVNVLLILASLITGCVSGTAPLASRMTPDLAGIRLPKTEKVLRLGAVTVGEITNPGEKGAVMAGQPRIQKEGFQEALINTLRSSGLFKEVTTAGEGDYTLSAQILSQYPLTDFSVTLVLFVNYRLVDRSGQEVWQENFLSLNDVMSEVTRGDEESPHDWWKRTKEGAAKDNLTQLVKKLSQVVTR